MDFIRKRYEKITKEKYKAYQYLKKIPTHNPSSNSTKERTNTTHWYSSNKQKGVW